MLRGGEDGIYVTVRPSGSAAIFREGSDADWQVSSQQPKRLVESVRGSGAFDQEVQVAHARR